MAGAACSLEEAAGPALGAGMEAGVAVEGAGAGDQWRAGSPTGAASVGQWWP